MKKLLMRFVCLLFGHDYRSFRYTVRSVEYNEVHMRYGLKCIHCGKVKL